MDVGRDTDVDMNMHIVDVNRNSAWTEHSQRHIHNTVIDMNKARLGQGAKRFRERMQRFREHMQRFREQM